ncbi:MAG: hypothetical protein U0556_08325 [Dehalococcoidia bacterium]
MRAGVFIVVLAGLLTAALPVAGQAVGYQLGLSRHDGGGGASSNAGYLLLGGAGQSAAGQLGGGSYTLNAGFFQPIPSASPSSNPSPTATLPPSPSPTTTLTPSPSPTSTVRPASLAGVYLPTGSINVPGW